MSLGQSTVKTTIELPDELYREAKAKAALSGRKLKDLIEQGLRLALVAPARPRPATLSELMAPACGVFESSVDDLGTNPVYLSGLGEDPGPR
jgi:hypothetical protein